MARSNPKVDADLEAEVTRPIRAASSRGASPRRTMPALRRSVGVALMAVLIFAARLTAAGPQPSWIWSAESKATEESLRFVKVFRTPARTVAARLRFAPVSTRLVVWLDGRVVAACEPYDPFYSRLLDAELPAGDHEIVVTAAGVRGPSAFCLQLDLEFSGAASELIVSDDTWRLSRGEPATVLGPVEAGLIPPEDRRVEVKVVDDYEQWQRALGAQAGADPAFFQIAQGYEIQLVRSAAPDEDSWVSLAFDPQGRLIIAKESVGLLRMTLSPDGKAVNQVEVIDDTLAECRGLAFLGDDLYANANNSKALYRLRADGERFAQPECVFASTGGVGHGRNDLAVGADGRLYAIHGDSVDLPPTAIDYTSPFREARRGEPTSEGHLLRIDPESPERVEILAAGLRNPFGIDFNRDGEVFTYDADAEYDMGAPWYRPTRVSHLVTGGDYGWRGVTQSWPPYYPDHPDNARPNLDIGKGSPTAVKFGHRSNFPPPYHDAFFILDWAYGRILAVHMLARGSSYLMSAETFLQGRPLNVTDLDFAPDGSLYFVTGGRKTQSALYRVTYVGGRPEQSETATPYQIAREQFAEESRRVRRQLEAELVGSPSERRIDLAWQHLSDPDPWIRYAALNLIERHPVEMWQARALGESAVRPALLGLTALARAGQPDRFPAIMRRLNDLLPAVSVGSDQSTAYYIYWLCLQGTDELDAVLRQAVRESLEKMYPSGAYTDAARAHNRLLSELLVQLGSRDAVAKTIRLLQVAPSQSEQLHYLFALRNARHGWTIDDRRVYFEGLAQGRYYVGGAGMNSFLAKIREEAVQNLTEAERQQLRPWLEARLTPEESIDTTPRPTVRNWALEDLLPLADRTAEPNVARGAEVFASARCVQCHRFGTRGTPIGPDLTSVSRRFSRRDLLTSIVEPSRVIAENYRSLQIVTKGGRTHVGQATLGGDYRSSFLRLSTDATRPFEFVEIPKGEIESQQESSVSWMPTGLLDTFNLDEIFDLLMYLESSP